MKNEKGAFVNTDPSQLFNYNAARRGFLKKVHNRARSDMPNESAGDSFLHYHILNEKYNIKDMSPSQ